MREHIWTDERPCWANGKIRLRVGERNPAGSAVAVEDGVFIPCDEHFPLRTQILADEILRLAEEVEEAHRLGAELEARGDRAKDDERDRLRPLLERLEASMGRALDAWKKGRPAVNQYGETQVFTSAQRALADLSRELGPPEHTAGCIGGHDCSALGCPCWCHARE